MGLAEQGRAQPHSRPHPVQTRPADRGQRVVRGAEPDGRGRPFGRRCRLDPSGEHHRAAPQGPTGGAVSDLLAEPDLRGSRRYPRRPSRYGEVSAAPSAAPSPDASGVRPVAPRDRGLTVNVPVDVGQRGGRALISSRGHGSPPGGGWLRLPPGVNCLPALGPTLYRDTAFQGVTVISVNDPALCSGSPVAEALTISYS